MNTYGYVEGNPLSTVDPLGLLPGFGPPVVNLICGGSACHLPPPSPEITPPNAADNNQYSEGANSEEDLQKQIEREANRREYKRICDERPPQGLNDCERAKWELRKVQMCKAARDENNKRWWNGQDDFHDDQLYEDIERKIEKAQAAVRRHCKCEK